MSRCVGSIVGRQPADCRQQSLDRPFRSRELRGRHEFLPTGHCEEHPQHLIGVSRQSDQMLSARSVSAGEPVFTVFSLAPVQKATIFAPARLTSE